MNVRRSFEGSSLPGWLALLAPLAVAVASVSPHVAFWDVGEEQTVPWMLGVMHPTGFPLFVLAGWLWDHVLPVSTPAWRIGALSALALAFASRNAYALGRAFGLAPWTALGAALLFAFGDVAWSRGSRAEVHVLALAALTWALLAAVRYARDGKARDARALAFATGCALATHSVAVLAVPGLVLMVLPRLRALDARTALQCAALVAVCLAAYAYLPVRSAVVFAERRDPTLALGVPPGRPFWDYDHPATPAGFVREAFGTDFDVDDGAGALARIDRFGLEFVTFGHMAATELGPLAIAASIAGLAFIARDEPFVAAGSALAVLLVVPFATNYHAISDIDRWFLPAYWLAAVLAGVGVARVTVRGFGEPSALATTLGALVVGTCALLQFGANVRNFDEAKNDVRAVRWIDRVLARTPDEAVIVATWPYATPLAYAAYVEGRLGNRIVEAEWIGDDARYIARWVGREHRAVYAQVERDPPEIPGYTLKRVDMEEHPGLYVVTR